VWWEGNKWREELNSSIVNVDFTNNLVGDRYQRLMSEWTTVDSGKTDAQGKYSFRGYQGEYEVTLIDGENSVTDTLELIPATDAAAWNLALPAKPVAIGSAFDSFTSSRTLYLNGMPLSYSAPESLPLTLSVFGSDGRRIWSAPVTKGQTHVQTAALPQGAFHYRLTSGGKEIKMGLGYKI
jgi:hypothetical protein